MSVRHVVLVVDDNDINRLNLKLLLKSDYQVVEAGDVEQAEKALAENRIDLVVLDLALPPEPDNPEIGMQYLERLSKESPDTPVVVITGHDEHSFAVRARKLGALDFFGKPFDPDEVRDTIARALEMRWKAMREIELQRMLEVHVGDEILGESEAMQELKALIGRVAPIPSTVLIRGETGVGKELVARKLHDLSPRVKGPFIAVNCASMMPEHLESELFGHEKGAFAGATRRKLGWFERASGGTLLLDEIAGIPLSVQGKLLRVLEHKEFSRLGGESVINCDVRLICSTKANLEQMVEEGSFRDDLYYRINVVDIAIPPLREHMDDIGVLAEHFLVQKGVMCNRQMRGFSDGAMREMQQYDWPGNVRELENVVERAVVLAAGDMIDTLPSLSGPRGDGGADPLEVWFGQLPASGIVAEQAVADFEKRLLLLALERSGNVKAKAGRWLGFGDRAKDKMRYLCDKYDVDASEEA